MLSIVEIHCVIKGNIGLERNPCFLDCHLMPLKKLNFCKSKGLFTPSDYAKVTITLRDSAFDLQRHHLSTLRSL